MGPFSDLCIFRIFGCSWRFLGCFFFIISPHFCVFLVLAILRRLYFYTFLAVFTSFGHLQPLLFSTVQAIFPRMHVRENPANLD